jgi:nucleoside-diphosphate-sugar epimerase
MHSDSSRSVLILGANGRFGQCVKEAFRQAGWHVYAQSRTPASGHQIGVTPVTCDALDVDSILRTCAGNIQVVVNALNPLYTEWETRLPPLADAALRIAREADALLMLPGNVYNFGSKLPPVISEDTPQIDDTSRAKLRIALENNMRAAAEQGVRSVVIRCGDFLGGDRPGTWMDLVIVKDLAKGRVVYPGPLDLNHAWAYLPDLAKVFVAVAERRTQLAPFDVFHYAGLTLSGGELASALEAAVGRSLDVRKLPWWLLRLASPFSPMFRAVTEMRYLWHRPHSLSEVRLRKLIGTVPRTDITKVLQSVLAPIDVESAVRIAMSASE